MKNNLQLRKNIQRFFLPSINTRQILNMFKVQSCDKIINSEEWKSINNISFDRFWPIPLRFANGMLMVYPETLCQQRTLFLSLEGVGGPLWLIHKNRWEMQENSTQEIENENDMKKSVFTEFKIYQGI